MGGFETPSEAAKPEATKSMPLVEFARAHMGIELNEAQIQMLEWAAEGKILIRARTTGRHTARKVAQAWLRYGITGVTDLELKAQKPSTGDSEPPKPNQEKEK